MVLQSDYPNDNNGRITPSPLRSSITLFADAHKVFSIAVKKFGGACDVCTQSPLLLCRKCPDRSFQFVERESNGFGLQAQSVLTQIAAFVENGEQHQTGA